MSEYGRIHKDGSRSGGQPLHSDVERVARALAQADGIEICSDATYALSSYGHKAQAALAAMRQPAKTEAIEHVIHSSMPIDFERRYAMDNLIAQDADLIDLVGRLHEQADRQYGSIGSLRSVEWEAADCIEEMDRHLTMSGKVSKALSERIEVLEAEIEQWKVDYNEAQLDAEGVKLYWYRQGKDDGVEHERAKIVAWLRKEAIMSTDTVRRRMNKALDQIEAGEHLK